MSTSSASAKKKAAAAPAAKSPTARGSLEAHKILNDAVASFVRENLPFESSVAATAILEEIEAAGDVASVFEIPLQRMVFPMDVALRWLLFLEVAPAHAVEKGDKAFAGGGHTAAKGLALISKTYDVGMEDAVWDHFEEEDDEDEDEDDDGDD